MNNGIPSLYVVLDTLAEQILGAPLIFRADAAAVRLFSEAYNDANSVVAKHPNDHVLLCLGTIDDKTGQVVAQDTPRIVITGTQLALTAMEARS